MQCIAVVAVATLVVAFGAPLWATTVIGDPWEEDSWSQLFQQTTSETSPGVVHPPASVGPFDLIQFRMNNLPSDAYNDLFKSITATGWTTTLYDGGIYAVLSGPAVTSGSKNFTVTFKSTLTKDPTGYKNDPLCFSIQVYSPQGTLRQNQDVYWSGTGWNVAATPTWEAESPIPEPVTMAGLMLGIGSVVGYARKRRKA